MTNTTQYTEENPDPREDDDDSPIKWREVAEWFPTFHGNEAREETPEEELTFGHLRYLLGALAEVHADDQLAEIVSEGTRRNIQAVVDYYARIKGELAELYREDIGKLSRFLATPWGHAVTMTESEVLRIVSHLALHMIPSPSGRSWAQTSMEGP